MSENKYPNNTEQRYKWYMLIKKEFPNQFSRNTSLCLSSYQIPKILFCIIDSEIMQIQNIIHPQFDVLIIVPLQSFSFFKYCDILPFHNIFIDENIYFSLGCLLICNNSCGKFIFHYDNICCSSFPDFTLIHIFFLFISFTL